MTLDLPYSLIVDNEDKEINCDFRDIIEICIALNDPSLNPMERLHVMLNNLYVDDYLNFEDMDTAIKQAVWFIDWGKDFKTVPQGPKIMDWKHDYNMIIAAVNNKISTNDIRELPFMHWWTFLGYFSERGECQFSTVTSIRDKINKDKSLDKWEKEILRENHDDIILSDEETDELDHELFGGD